eukprot:1158773-Pelagomonas_calceolata.AAC.18
MEFWWWELGFTPRLIRHVRPFWHLTNSSATGSFTRNPSLKGASWGAPMHGSMQKHLFFRPQLTPL